MKHGGMLQVKFPCGSLLRDLMHNSAEHALVSIHVKKLPPRRVVSDSDG